MKNIISEHRLIRFWIYLSILLTSSISPAVASDHFTEDSFNQLLTLLPSSYVIPEHINNPEQKISVIHLTPTSVDLPDDVLDFFKIMLVNHDLLRRNYSQSYLESLHQRSSGDLQAMPKLFIKDALERNVYFLFIKDLQSNVCCGYFSFRPYKTHELNSDHPLRPLFDHIQLQNGALYNIGAFFLPEYRQKGIFSHLANEMIVLLKPKVSDDLHFSLSSDTDHPIIHTFISKHPEYGFQLYNKNAYNEKYFYTLLK